MNRPPEQTHVLLVEDSPADARLIQLYLSEGNSQFTVSHVERLSDGLEQLSQGGVDVVLLDLNLPDSTGLDTFTRIYEYPLRILRLWS